MAANTPFNLSETSQALLINYHKNLGGSQDTTINRRYRMEAIDKAYLRETNTSLENYKAKLANKAGDLTKFQDAEVPVIQPQVEAFVNYQAAVFLADVPIMGVVAAPDKMDQAMAFNAIIEENSQTAGWVSELCKFFYSAARYNIGAVECSWDSRVVPSLETDLEFSMTQAKPVDIVWQGNTITHWDLYNTYFDPIPEPKNICKEGTYAGTTRLMSKIALKKFVASLGERAIYKNLKAAFESQCTVSPIGDSLYGASFYMPSINYAAIIDKTSIAAGDNWNAYAGLNPANGKSKFEYKAVYEVSTEYIRILPSEFEIKVPQDNTPQVWKLIIVNHEHIIMAERLSNAHDMIPVFFAQPQDDGLNSQTKSLAEAALPFQNIASSLVASILASRRRAVGDRLLYNPALVDSKHINNPNPTARIPVKPSAFGKPLSEAVYQFPYRDDISQGAFQELQVFLGMADKLNGQNAARAGQFVKGNKTDAQWQEVMNNATSKDQRTALNLEVQLFTPLKECIKLNILQYQGSGDIYSPSSKKVVTFDAAKIRESSLFFKMTDGMLPTSKVMSPQARMTAMQVIGSSPNLAGAYNLGPMFSYIMKLEKVDLTPFEKSQPQMLYEQAMNQWSQLAQLAIQKQAPFQTPMPKPSDYNYDPTAQTQESASSNLAATSMGSPVQQ